MKIKDIQKIQKTINSVTDFIDANSDADKSGIRKVIFNDLSDCNMLLKKEKERIFLNNIKRKIKKTK